jgi:hypothetical protein
MNLWQFIDSVVIGLYFCAGWYCATKTIGCINDKPYTGARRRYALTVSWFGAALMFFGWGFYSLNKDPNKLFHHADRLANDLPFKPWNFKED